MDSRPQTISTSGENAACGASDRIALLPSLLVAPLLPHLHQHISLLVEKIQAARKIGDDRTISKLIEPGQRFVPTASSLTLGVALSDEEIRQLLRAVCNSPATACIEQGLGTPAACDLSQSWVRRQYAPGRYPPGHAPHGWHQDGALGFDFLSYPDGNFPGEALLGMVTCWIALDPCGLEAPGLELITKNLPQLLQPSDLADSRIRDRFPAESFWHPTMQPGDALVFPGDILHRTYVTPAMTRDRSSIELRFFAADNLPARLKDDRFLAIGKN